MQILLFVLFNNIYMYNFFNVSNINFTISLNRYTCLKLVKMLVRSEEVLSVLNVLLSCFLVGLTLLSYIMLCQTPSKHLSWSLAQLR